MKRSTKAVMILAAVVIIGASFKFGAYTNEQKNIQSRQQHCSTLIGFAIDKLETKDLQDQNIMAALVSNVYAAYEYCDDPVLAGQLHDLWNSLIFDREACIEERDALVEILRDTASSVTNES